MYAALFSVCYVSCLISLIPFQFEINYCKRAEESTHGINSAVKFQAPRIFHGKCLVDMSYSIWTHKTCFKICVREKKRWITAAKKNDWTWWNQIPNRYMENQKIDQMIMSFEHDTQMTIAFSLSILACFIRLFDYSSTNV